MALCYQLVICHSHTPASTRPPCRSKRQRYFGITAAVLLALQTGYTAAYVASYAVVLSAKNCKKPYARRACCHFCCGQPRRVTAS